MKTFDIAVEYMKGFNFDGLINYTPEFRQRTEGVWIRYSRDPANIISNEYYRKIVLEAALRHCYDLHLKVPSRFMETCKIIKDNIDIIRNKHSFFLFKKKYERYNNTIYPKAMVDKFLIYCRTFDNTIDYLREDSELRFDFFCVAYHYTVDPIS